MGSPSQSTDGSVTSVTETLSGTEMASQMYSPEVASASEEVSQPYSPEDLFDDATLRRPIVDDLLDEAAVDSFVDEMLRDLDGPVSPPLSPPSPTLPCKTLVAPRQASLPRVVPGPHTPPVKRWGAFSAAARLFQAYYAWTQKDTSFASVVGIVAIGLCYLPVSLSLLEQTNATPSVGIPFNASSVALGASTVEAAVPSAVAACHFLTVGTLFTFLHLLTVDPSGGNEAWTSWLLVCHLVLSVMQLARGGHAFACSLHIFGEDCSFAAHGGVGRWMYPLLNSITGFALSLLGWLRRISPWGACRLRIFTTTVAGMWVICLNLTYPLFRTSTYPPYPSSLSGSLFVSWYLLVLVGVLYPANRQRMHLWLMQTKAAAQLMCPQMIITVPAGTGRGHVSFYGGAKA